ncbi:MAG: hypothetical protein ACI9NQ_001236 [Paracoccaceae bacterium]|jgi:hypothetical protein
MDEQDWMTTEARASFEEWMAANEAGWVWEGADPSEIREDVEAHLLARRGDENLQVTREQLELVVGEMMAPDAEEVRGSDGRKKKRDLGFWGSLVKLVISPFRSRVMMGIWPLMVVMVAGSTGMLDFLFFDPISRIAQLVLLSGVGLVGLIGHIFLRKKQVDGWWAFLWGMALVPAVYWGLFSIPSLVMGTIFYGYGVLVSVGLALMALPLFFLCFYAAWAPILAATGFWKLSAGSRKGWPWMAGLVAGFVTLVAVEAPAYVTRYGMEHDDVALVRNWGSEELLQQIASQGTWQLNSNDTSGHVLNLGTTVNVLDEGSQSLEDVVASRSFYYRVTGRDVFDVKSETFLTRQLRRSRRGDENQGGDVVGKKVSGLDLGGSRLDGHVDGASGLGYWEWTMEFHNSELMQREARMQVQLPPGGVVSRLTLWVEGEPQEAAFAAKSKVTAAYKSVVQARRDPVLVRWIGADRVLVQCFPVPERGTMKIRLGVTAPLDSDGRLFLPRISEKNFAFDDDLETRVWIQGDVEMSMGGLKGEGAHGQWREVHGALDLADLTASHTHVKCEGLPEESVVWTKDQFAPANERYLIREKRRPEEAREKSIVLVVDGSGYFKEWQASFQEGVESLKNHGHKVRVVCAAEEGVREDDGARFVGGQDNMPALLRGLEVAAEVKADELIWLHGDQPIDLEGVEGFLQLMERGFSKVAFSTVDLGGGPNRLLEQIEGRIPVVSSGRPGGPEDLPGELQRVIRRTGDGFVFRRAPEGTEPEGREVWDQLARYSVWERVMAGVLDQGSREELAKLAGRYQLVTPVSGAVVLESEKQFEQFGLDQVDESTAPSIPGVPEPSTVMLVLISMMSVWRRRRGGMA